MDGGKVFGSWPLVLCRLVNGRRRLSLETLEILNFYQSGNQEIRKRKEDINAGKQEIRKGDYEEDYEKEDEDELPISYFCLLTYLCGESTA